MKRLAVVLLLLALPVRAAPIVVEISPVEADFLAELLDQSCKASGIIRGTCRNAQALLDRIGRAAAATVQREKADNDATAEALHKADVTAKALAAAEAKLKALAEPAP